MTSSFSSGQNKDTPRMKNSPEIKSKYSDILIVTNDTLIIEPNIKKTNFKIGIQVGLHSSNLTNKSVGDFNRDILLELYICFDLSDEVHLIIAFNYWE
ncbi:MAG: hypothetical protein Q7R95_04390, partial [bacterium]|nr:hypothetical protein [bacterium]